MESLDERSRRIILSVIGTMFFFYSCVILPLYRILPYGTLKKTAQLERTPLGSFQGSVESKFYYDTIELHYWISGILDFRGQFELSYSGIGKNSDYWFLWHATEIWGPISFLLVTIAVIIVLSDSISILIWGRPSISAGWKFAGGIVMAVGSIGWLFILWLWLSGENSDSWLPLHATEIWLPISLLLVISAVIILLADSISILIWGRPSISAQWKFAGGIGIAAVSIEWLLFLLLWLSGEAEAGTAVGTIGLKPVPGWPLLFLNLLGVLGLLWAAFQKEKAARL
ncbi:MAG: hypothetical protein ACXAEI_17725 [Candidatus Hodarchaeales archaeon]|jgi:hypothetical protein